MPHGPREHVKPFCLGLSLLEIGFADSINFHLMTTERTADDPFWFFDTSS